MSVKCLTADAQRNIVEAFEGRLFNINTLAELYGVSRRTVIRVLKEAGVDPCIATRSKKAPTPTPAPKPIVYPTSRPWYRRLFTGVTWPSFNRGIGE